MASLVCYCTMFWGYLYLVDQWITDQQVICFNEFTHYKHHRSHNCLVHNLTNEFITLALDFVHVIVVSCSWMISLICTPKPKGYRLCPCNSCIMFPSAAQGCGCTYQANHEGIWYNWYVPCRHWWLITHSNTRQLNSLYRPTCEIRLCNCKNYCYDYVC